MTYTLQNWTKRPVPGNASLEGRFVRIEPLETRHLPGLYAATAGPGNARIWSYMPNGPFETLGAFSDEMMRCHGSKGWRVMVISCANTKDVLGMASYMRIRREHGSCEIGLVAHGSAMQRTAAATQAHYLLARHVFEDLGYRRYEWKCNTENAASKRAAQRYGFTYEGTFRQDMVVKGTNRDTAWYSMLDSDWPKIKARFQNWLNPSNFDSNGQQQRSLEDFKRY